MSKRAYLHNLVREMRCYLEWQKALGVPGFVPASEEARAELEARKAALEEERMKALRAKIRGEDPPEPATPTPAPRPGPTPEKKGPPGRPSLSGSQDRNSPGIATAKEPSGGFEDSDDDLGKKTSSPEITEGTALWKSQPTIHQMRQRRQELQAQKRGKAPMAGSLKSEVTGSVPEKSVARPNAEPPPFDDEPPFNEEEYFRGEPASGPAPGPEDYEYHEEPPKRASKGSSMSSPKGPSTGRPKDGKAAIRGAKKKEMSPEEKLDWLREYLGDCKRCALCESRKNVVFGEGSARARLLFVSEAPGQEEDLQGLPIVGPPDELLTKMIAAMGLNREEVYIANVVKCRAPQNRDPLPGEVKECAPFLKKQIAVIQPEVIVTLGAHAANLLLAREESMGELRGKWHQFEEIALMPTYHPADLLRKEGDRELKRKAWSDLQQVMKRLGLST